MANISIYPSYDTYIDYGSQTTNYDTSTTLIVKNYSGYSRSTLLLFDLSGIPNGASITSVKLKTYCASFSDPVDLRLYECLKSWVSDEATWNIYSTGNNWSTAGCADSTLDYDGSTVLSSKEVSPAPSTDELVELPTSSNFTSLIVDNIGGECSFVVKDLLTTNGIYQFHSVEHATAGLRPVLYIEYEPLAVDADLPAIEIEATGIRAPYVDATLPTLSLETPGFVIGYLFSKLPQLKTEAYLEYSTKITAGDVFNDFTLTLPNLKCEAESGERGSLGEDLPTLSVEAYGGANLEESLPDLSIDATCLPGYTGQLDSNLPFIQLECRMAHRADELKLSPIGIEATASSPVLCRLDKTLPSLGISATITAASGSLSKDLPPLGISATGYVNGIGTLDKTLPGLLIAADGYSGAIGTVDKPLPDLRITAIGGNREMSLDATLPALMVSQSSGGDYGNQDMVMTDNARLDDFGLLRYERWA